MPRAPAPEDRRGDTPPASAPRGAEPSPAPTRTAAPSLPALTLPKGGGALRGLGEKLSIGPTGTASFTVPLPASPGRTAATTPQLTLSYDSATGNGPFGLGWTLSTPAITRKTEKALPTYRDDDDTFVLSGVEDLVPALIEGPGGWARDAGERDGFRVERYRPRVEADFARVERWTELVTGDVHWRSTSRDNVTTIYGATAAARLADPADPRRVFEWRIEEVRDDRGNLCRYEYAAEDATGVDPGRPEERNRTDGVARFAGAYLARVRYANHTPFVAGDWHLTLVFDHGDHDADVPLVEPDRPWPVRLDPCSRYRAGFEVRTYRLCRRVLMFHAFEALGAAPQLVRSLELIHDQRAEATTVTSLVQRGHVRDGDGYRSAAWPALELGYTAPLAEPELRVLDEAGAANLPVGPGASFQWVDLDSEGLSGVLTEQGGGWFYKRNLGDGALGPLELIATTPRSGLGAGAQLLDLAGDGTRYLATMSGPAPGYYQRRDDAEGWTPFAAFTSMPVLDWTSRFQRLLDLDGDGLADVLITEDEVWSWHASLGTDGFGPRNTVPVERDEERGPVAIFADAEQSIFLGDFSGDGLVDLGRVRNGEVCYWPNLGYGRFGAKVTMSGSPVFDHPDQFDPKRLRLADVDGTGTADLVYLGRDAVRWWRNQAGNGWSEAHTFPQLPCFDNLAAVSVFDFLGNGTSCVVWSSPAPRDVGRPLAYLDLMGGQKPYLLASMRNGLGAERTLQYAPSTKFYAADRDAGEPWVTKVPFPIQVVERVETRDLVTGNRFVSTYSYHHGYHDGVEQEFRGFGRVDQLDTEAYAPVGEPLDVPPVLTRTWYHTGAFLDGERIETRLAAEYWHGDAHPQAALLADTVMPAELTSTAELVEAHRCLRGSVLRREVYARDGVSDAPYLVSERSYAVRRLQPLAGQRHAVMFAHPRETIDLHYERTDDPRVSHEVTLEVDPLGEVRRAATISYPRRGAAPFAEQGVALLTYDERDVAHVVDRPDWYRVGAPVELRRHELAAASVPASGRFGPEDVEALVPARRLVEQELTLYTRDDLAGPLGRGELESRAIVFETYRLAFTAARVGELYGDRVTDAMLVEAGHVAIDGAWWTPSGRLEVDAAAFYQPARRRDPFGNVASVTYDDAALLAIRTESSQDPVLSNAIICVQDYRVLGPAMITDPNGNRTAVGRDERGMVVAIAALGKTDGEADSLDDPTAAFAYDLDAVPVSARTSLRERHGAANPRWQVAYEYSDGFGRLVQKKAQAEPDPLTAAPRWVGSGRTVFNNKGQPVKQYEPFFSATHAYETEAAVVERGVTPLLHYDPPGRLVRTDFPDGTLTREAVEPWCRATWDRNDTVLESRWLEEHAGERAAELASAHAGTPTIAHLDPLGRTFLSVVDRGADGTTSTRAAHDLLGNLTAIVDELGREAMVYAYTMTGVRVYQRSIDAGERWTLPDVDGKPSRSWDSRGHARRIEYDALRRPTHTWVELGGVTRLVDRVVHGEHVAGGAADNLRGKLFAHYDDAGVSTTPRYDLDGNLEVAQRRVARDPATPLDWSALGALVDPGALAAAAAPLLDDETFTTAIAHDALGRMVQRTTPDLSVTAPLYNEANLLERVTVTAHGETTDVVSRIDYDARGQRTAIEYGGGVRTVHTYDPLTFRLTGLTTTRLSGGAVLQALAYTYDPVGNVVAITDDASPTTYFDNQAVTASARYEYDAAYRLRRAEGRELIALATAGALGHDDAPLGPLPGDAQAVQRYVETYAVDALGNPTAVTHSASQGGWTRSYTYASGSNRLVSTGGGSHAHDAHGNTTAMPHLASMAWSDRDWLRRVDLGGGGTAHYAYDGAGVRVRKVVETQGAVTRERIYLGAYEVYRERVGPTVQLERQTLHVMDGERRVALVDTLVGGEPRVRYQLGDHLGSSVLEVDRGFVVLSYEQYYPYGGTAYRAGASKRYRWIGKERDEETGLYYHGARYYAPWLGVWTAADPAGPVDGISLYVYARSNPILRVDLDGKESVILGLQKDPPETKDPKLTEAENKNFLRRAEGLKKSMVKGGSTEANLQVSGARTGAEVLEKLKKASDTGEVKNFVVYGHSYTKGLYMHSDKGFYRDARTVSAAEYAGGARNVKDLKAMMDSGEVRFARDAVAVFVSCGCGGDKNFDSASFAADFTMQTGVTSIAAIGLTWPEAGNDAKQVSEHNRWVKIEKQADGTLKQTPISGSVDPLTYVKKDDAAPNPRPAPPPPPKPPVTPPPPVPKVVPPPSGQMNVGASASGSANVGTSFWESVARGLSNMGPTFPF